MGADYIWANCPIPSKFVTGPYTVDVKGFTAHLTDVIGGLDDTEVIGIVEDYGWEPDDEGFGTAREFLAEMLTTFTGCFASRACALGKIGGVTFIHTGEMSWGDSSEEMQAIWAMDSVLLLAP